MNLVILTMFDCFRHNGMILSIFLVCPMCSLAQSKRAFDVVHLKNDLGVSEVHGHLIPAQDSGKIALRDRDENVWVFSRSDVKAISRENPVFHLSPRGWYNTTSAGLYFADDKGYQISTVIGYRFHYRYYAGLGAAIDQYTLRALPVFADFKADLLLKKNTPFSYIDAGITNPWPKKNDPVYGMKPDKKISGWYLNAGVGQRIRTGKNGKGLALSLGYSLETLKLRYDPKPYPDPGYPGSEGFVETPGHLYAYTFNRLVVRIGVTL